ncbi:SDR family oxidoreductase [Parapusillimonas granuli]|uniref:SDR family oxidoreductase n=1 Tax=Parapusillimonas granuli TaxID=380911 RepID=A0A853FZI9_9BURK|nr:SDR family oxidoreductase [Parapusillimonas granuli]MBB5215306.1 NAD(P)-dependent dehydrogenase (short-subunit alcohol dehydrogenase family) [Parapusillimonas granuli]NYT50023.1 SDR family oxidoreductase [Parapusillimonas granuli]
MAQKGLFVVTGGTRGIGAAIARMASRSWPVVMMYRSDIYQAQAMVAEINASGGEAHSIQVDIGDEQDVVRAFTLIDNLGRPEVLVNNAAITGGVSRVKDVRADVLDAVFRTNITGPFLASREAIRRMSSRSGGSGGCIVNISSGASVLGSPNNWVHYAASKGAIDTFTVGLSKEVAKEGIRVNAVRPGVVDTEIHHSREPAELQAMINAIPLGRMGTIDEISQAVMWLASPAASYVTGALLDVRGGF